MANELIETLALTVDGSASDTLRPFRIHGIDEISRLFRFEIEALSDDPGLSDSDLLGRSATLAIGRQDETAEIHGMITQVDQGPATERGQYAYTVILMPRLHLLAMSRQNQIHGTTGDVSAVDVITAELTAESLKGPGAALAGRMAATDFEMRLSASYPQRDHIVQYDETDLDFICRLAEAQGIFFFFDHASGKDKVVFGDSGVAFTPAAGHESIPYRRVSGLAGFSLESVRDFRRHARPLPTKVILRDYNYRLPHVSLTAEATVDSGGHGVVVEYGNHFRTPDEGNRLARIRAEEIKARGVVFTGESDCVALSAGRLFSLTDHFRDDFNTRYVITKITHSATMAQPGLSEIAGGELETSYSNTFECIASDVAFRPERRTPKPQMAGLANATVDAEGSGTRAEIDDQGRYKVRQSFDLREEADGKASQYVRKAEPYGGANSGMHMPLLKGTEVILACVNGDPDRPIIVGAVPNPRNKSVITQREQTSNRLRTTAGIVLQMDDGAGPSSSGGTSGSGLARQQVQAGQQVQEDPPSVEMARPRPADSSSSGNDTRLFMNVTAGTDSDTSDDTYLRLGANRSSAESGYVADFTTVADGVLLYSPSDSNSLIKGACYTRVTGDLRTAAATINTVAETSMGLAAKALGIDVSSGTPSLTTTPGSSVGDGTFSITTASDFDQTIGGSVNQTVAGDFNQTITGQFNQETGGPAWEVTTGNSQEVYMGNQVSVTLGASQEFSLSSALGVAVGNTIDLALALAIEITISMGITYEGSLNILVNDKGKIGLKLAYEAEYNVLGATATEVEAESKTVEASAKTVEANSSSVAAKSQSVEAKTQSVSAQVPALKVVI
jgi:type VI secretion system VgrG family protein